MNIHERLAVIVGCSPDDDRIDQLYDFIQDDRAKEKAPARRTARHAPVDAPVAGGLHDSDNPRCDLNRSGDEH